jgi:hypothetical protein
MDEDELLLEEEESLEDPGDEGVFEIDLEEGVVYEAAVLSDELLDPVVEVFDEDGELLFSDNDSLFGLEPYLQFTVPEDGTYEIVVSDIEDETGDYTLLLGESDVLIA